VLHSEYHIFGDLLTTTWARAVFFSEVFGILGSSLWLLDPLRDTTAEGVSASSE
jgi:hypothetical protein